MVSKDNNAVVQNSVKECLRPLISFTSNCVSFALVKQRLFHLIADLGQGILIIIIDKFIIIIQIKALLRDIDRIAVFAPGASSAQVEKTGEPQARYHAFNNQDNEKNDRQHDQGGAVLFSV